MVQPFIAREIAERSDEPGLRIRRAEHDAIDPGEHQRTRAHRTGFERDDEGASLEVPRTGDLARGAKRQDLRVGGRVAAMLPLVAGRRDRLAVARNDRADRNVAPRGTPVRPRPARAA